MFILVYNYDHGKHFETDLEVIKEKSSLQTSSKMLDITTLCSIKQGDLNKTYCTPINFHTSQNKLLKLPNARKDVEELDTWLNFMLQKEETTQSTPRSGINEEKNSLIGNMSANKIKNPEIIRLEKLTKSDKKFPISDTFLLQKKLKGIPLQNAQTIYSACLMEVIRQVSIDCSERGQFLKKIWDGYIGLLETALIESQKVSEQKEKSSVEEIKRIHDMYGQEIEHLKIEVNLLNQDRDENIKLIDSCKHESRNLKAKIKKLTKDLHTMNKENQELKKENEQLMQKALDGNTDDINFDYTNNTKITSTLRNKKKNDHNSINLTQQRTTWQAGNSSVVSHLLFLKYGDEKSFPEETGTPNNMGPQAFHSPVAMTNKAADDKIKTNETFETYSGLSPSSFPRMGTTRFDENINYLNEGEEEGIYEEEENVEYGEKRDSILGFFSFCFYFWLFIWMFFSNFVLKDILVFILKLWIILAINILLNQEFCHLF